MLTGPGTGPILRVMRGEPDIHEIDRKLAVLEERMETQLAKTESAIDRLRADMLAYG